MDATKLISQGSTQVNNQVKNFTLVDVF